MGIRNDSLVSVGARTLLVAAIIVVLLGRREGPWSAVGRIVSGLTCAAFLLGYINPDIRDDLGKLVVPRA